MINLNFTKEQISAMHTNTLDNEIGSYISVLEEDWLTLYDEVGRLNKALQGAMGEIENKNRIASSDGSWIAGHAQGIRESLSILRRHLGKE